MNLLLEQKKKTSAVFKDWSLKKVIFKNGYQYIWCKYTIGPSTSSLWPGSFFLYLETLEKLFEKNFPNKIFFLIVGQHFGNIFECSNKKQQNVGKLGLLIWVLAKNCFNWVFLYHHVGAYLRNFWNKKCWSIMKKIFCLQFFSQKAFLMCLNTKTNDPSHGELVLEPSMYLYHKWVFIWSYISKRLIYYFP